MSDSRNIHLREVGRPIRLPPWPFFAQEYLRIMRSRLALLIWAVLLYTLVALAFSDGQAATGTVALHCRLARPGSGGGKAACCSCGSTRP